MARYEDSPHKMDEGYTAEGGQSLGTGGKDMTDSQGSDPHFSIAKACFSVPQGMVKPDIVLT